MGKEFTVNLCTPDFGKIATTKEGMFMAEDDYGESYYYRGQADNWVDFAGFYWKIIRINGDGTTRLIYSGTKTNNTGYGAQIGASTYNASYDNEKYADYKISTVKNTVENWYKTNILDKGYNNKIADTGYCNDMTKYNSTYFSSYNRLYTNKAPTLKCPDKASDLLSKSNNKLTYPVGLLTLDEASFAGGVYDNVENYKNKNYYLYTGELYWTMTPVKWSDSIVSVGLVNHRGSLVDGFTGYLNGSLVATRFGVRPVLSLKPSVNILSGDGTEANPYRVS